MGDRLGRPKKKNKKRTFLNEQEKKEFAQHLIDGRMIKQVAAEYSISIPYGYQIFRELLEWKMEWKLKPDVPHGELTT